MSELNNLFNLVEQPIQPPTDEKSSDEVAFLREQIRRQDTMIESLNKELEKEREHNREKDRQLLDTLSKLAETQAALAAGQNAEKQKALAETLIEGQQMMEEDHKLLAAFGKTLSIVDMENVELEDGAEPTELPDEDLTTE